MGRNNRQRSVARARQRAARRANAATGGFAGERAGGFGGGWPDGFVDGAWDAEPPPSAAPARTIDDRTVDDRVADDVADAVQRLRSRHGQGVEQAVARVLLTAQTPATATVATSRLHTMLTEGVALAWEHGWQPADLHRLTRRELDEGAQRVLGDAMAHQLGRFAEITLSPRWPAQLREAGATTWWPRDTDPVTARATLRGTGGDAVVRAALCLIALLADLPRLERLDPLPGTASRSASARTGPEVEERVLTRVRALLAKAESTTYEAEAETFTAGAQALMARHSIDAAMLAASERRPADSPAAVRLGIDRPYEQPKVLLLDAVATANRCRTVWSKTLGFVTVIGFEPDLTATETIFTSLLVQATAAVTGEGARVTRDGRSRTRAFRQSFLTAYAQRIGVRLRAVTEEETAAAVRESTDTPGAGGAETSGAEAYGGGAPQRGVLVRVLAQRAGEVDQRVDELFPRLHSRPMRVRADLEGWSAGVRAADRADLHATGSRLEEGRSA